MTGLRPGEVLALSVEDLDFDSRLIYVRKAAWHSKIQCTKNKSSAGTVPMPQELEAVLREYLSGWRPNSQGLLFSTKKGTPFGLTNVVQRKLWPILDQLNIPRCGLHAFRHTHASLLVSLGASPVVAQRQLRHSDPMTTLRNYVHVLGDEQRLAAEKVAQVLWPDVAKSRLASEKIQ